MNVGNVNIKYILNPLQSQGITSQKAGSKILNQNNFKLLDTKNETLNDIAITNGKKQNKIIIIKWSLLVFYN